MKRNPIFPIMLILALSGCMSKHERALEKLNFCWDAIENNKKKIIVENAEFVYLKDMSIVISSKKCLGIRIQSFQILPEAQYYLDEFTKGSYISPRGLYGDLTLENIRGSSDRVIEADVIRIEIREILDQKKSMKIIDRVRLR